MRADVINVRTGFMTSVVSSHLLALLRIVDTPDATEGYEDLIKVVVQSTLKVSKKIVLLMILGI